MKFGTRKIIYSFAIAAVIVLLTAIIGAASLYWYGVKQNIKIENIGGLKTSPARDVILGEPVEFSVLLKCPWHRFPTESTIETGKGICKISGPEISRVEWRAGYSIWRVSAKVKAYRTGNIPVGKMYISFNRYDTKTTDIGIDFTIPSINVIPINNVSGYSLEVAEKMSAIKAFERKWYLILGILLAAVVIIFLLYRRRNKNTVIITPWAAALVELSELRNNFRNGQIKADSCFVLLTDIVRQYLEKRFCFHAPSQTTSEFLLELNRPEGILPAPHRPFLKEFMTAADLVKFARQDPDEHLLSLALDKAELLIIETKPEEKDGGKK
jgi:hypothetical protein